MTDVPTKLNKYLREKGLFYEDELSFWLIYFYFWFKIKFYCISFKVPKL